MGLHSVKTKIRSRLLHYLFSVFFIGATAIACIPLAKTQGYHVVSFLLLFVVSLLSLFLSVGPVVVASTVAAIIWNYFFIPPHLTFHIDKTEDILIFGLFFIIALINGVMHTRIRNQEKITREREQRTHALFQLTKELSVASGIDEVIKVSEQHTCNYFRFTPIFLIYDDNQSLELKSKIKKEEELTTLEKAGAQRVTAESKQTIIDSGISQHPKLSILQPIKGSKMNLGVIIIRTNDPAFDQKENLWDAFLTQIINALEREFLAELARKVSFLNESDRLYRTLFNSISHEFRIPVAAIMGAADSLLNETKFPTIQKALSQEIITASLRLNRLIENLLNMSRLESGHLSVRLDWHDLNDLFNKVTDDLKEELKPYDLDIIIPENFPLVRIDFGLMEQVLYNILHNATQYTNPETLIKLLADYTDGILTITIKDHGIGFPEERLPYVFEKFFKASHNQTGGLGLGLSIAKGFVQAHGGQIMVENNENGGASFIIKLPTELPGFISI